MLIIQKDATSGLVGKVGSTSKIVPTGETKPTGSASVFIIPHTNETSIKPSINTNGD